jgi:hypothetical protein
MAELERALVGALAWGRPHTFPADPACDRLASEPGAAANRMVGQAAVKVARGKPQVMPRMVDWTCEMQEIDAAGRRRRAGCSIIHHLS